MLDLLSPEPRILLVAFCDPESLQHNFLFSHFHHDACFRNKQCQHIHKGLAPLIPSYTIFSYDHNSVLVPTRDVAAPPTHP